MCTRTTTSRRKPVVIKAALAATVAILIAGCRPGEEGPQVAGWSLADPAARHPIVVSQKPSNISIRVARGSQGMSPHQRAQLAEFIDRYRGAGSANSKLVIAAPSGAPNEVASMQAVAEIRHLLRASGFDETAVSVEAYHEDKDPQPAIRVSFMRYVAEAPECGRWPTNLASEPNNLPYPNFGCATQRNFAMQVANPADLLGPRGETARPGERRAVVWDKYTKGESTISQKQGDEKVQVKGAQ
jgi:pilus assembly protein CpaD